MKIKTAELTGAALAWAVAKCEGFAPFTDGISWIIDKAGTWVQLPKYSTDWAQGGPIIEREKIAVQFGPQWTAVHHKHLGRFHYGPTPLVAAMRTYVASKLGDEVEVPNALS